MLFDTSDLNLIQGKKEAIQTIKKIVETPKLNVTYNDLIHMHRKFQINPELYQDFTSQKFPQGFVFYDFEVFPYDWLVVLIDPINKTKDIICNEKGALEKYYEEHKDMIWVGYNNLHYDVPILKGILLGFNPKEVSDKIIVEQKSNYEIFGKVYDRFSKLKLLSYDVYDGVNSLKVLEGFMGNDIRETEVDFNTPRPLTQDEINQTCVYCIHDVEQTIEVFRRRIDDYNASVQIINMFNLPDECINKTKGQLTAMVVNCERKEHDDEFNITILPCIQLNKYAYIKEWFLEACKNKDYKAKLETEVCGIPHQFGWGGLHGAANKPIYRKGRIFHIDVTSYYPSMMIEWGFLTRNSKTPEKFKEVYDTRVALKKAGKKKEQAPFKIILNSQYGITKDKFSEAYDPVQANNICVNGQLMLLDLLEHLEGHASIIQSNTDGIILQVRDNDQAEAEMKAICKDWMERTRMGLGNDTITEIWQKDVNNYVFKFTNASLERKGAYVKELSELDYDLPIVNEALVSYMDKGIPVEDTINHCNEMIKFQKIVRVSSKYKYAIHNGIKLNGRTFRIYASNNFNDGCIGRCKFEGANVDKFGNTPEHCFIYNEDIHNCGMSIKLDKKWYINLAKKRLEDFGIEIKKEGALF